MIETKVAFLEGRLLSSQSEQSEKFSKSPDWLKTQNNLSRLVQQIAIMQHVYIV